MKYELINFNEWKQYVKDYTISYIKGHKIFKHIPSYITWDVSGTVEEVKDKVLDYVSALEVDDRIDECFLSLLYNGISIASYISGCGFFYESYFDAISDAMKSELYSRLSDLNNINDEEELDDDLYDYVCEIEQEWICDTLTEFNKNDVLDVLKSTNRL